VAAETTVGKPRVEDRKSKLFRSDIPTLFRGRGKTDSSDEFVKQIFKERNLANESTATPSFQPRFDEVTFPNPKIEYDSPKNLIYRVSKVGIHMSCGDIKDNKVAI
jgi:hypothetical protein